MGGAGQLGDRDGHPLGQLPQAWSVAAEWWVSFGTAVPSWSSGLAVARHLPHGRHQAGTATSTSTRPGTTSVAHLDSAFGPAQTFRMADASDVSRAAGAGLAAAESSEPARPFVGRLPELREFSAVLVEAPARRGCLFMVTGEPGIGKSRLMEEFAGLLA